VYRRKSEGIEPGNSAPLRVRPTPSTTHRTTSVQKLRIVTLRFGSGRQKMALERWTNPKLSRRACSPRYGVQHWRGKSADAAKRRREHISHPKPPPGSNSQLSDGLYLYRVLIARFSPPKPGLLPAKAVSCRPRPASQLLTICAGTDFRGVQRCKSCES
jgi:hypothetical protein